MSCVDCATGAAPCLDLPATTDVHGFAIDEAEVAWWGTCHACQTAAPRTTTEESTTTSGVSHA